MSDFSTRQPAVMASGGVLPEPAGGPHCPLSITDLVQRVRQTFASGVCKPKVVCVDFFDTLVYRIVAPEETKEVVAWQVARLFSGLSGAALYEIRRELEIKLCRLRVANGADADFDVIELYREMHHILIQVYGYDRLSLELDPFIRLLCDIELAMEKHVQRLHPDMLDMLTWIRQQEVTVCLVSDFYIPEKYFSRLLDHHGLGHLFDQIFVSTDHQCTKGGGRLYHEVCRQLHCNPTDLLMIGDNFHADVRMAEAAGICSLMVDASHQRALYGQRASADLSAEMRQQALIREFETILAEHRSQPFVEMGATLWLCVRSLFDHLRQEGVEHVFFCSKEGEFLKTLFELYQELMFGCQLITSHYLLVSRKATFICSLAPLAEESFSRLFDHYRDLSLEEFVLSLNFSSAQVAALQNELCCDWSVRRPDLKSHEEYAALLRSSLFQEMYESYRLQQRENLRTYLNSFHVDFSQSGLHLVDVGWKGSIQDSIYLALDRKIAVHGLFIGLLNPTGLAENNTKKGILFANWPQLTPFIHVYNNNRSLFEMVLGASHGSADGYFTREQWQQVGGQRVSEVRLWTAGEDSVAVTTVDLPKERRLFNENILPLQSVYRDIFEKLTKALILARAEPPSLQWFAQRHARMCFKPTAAEVDFFSRLYHLENFGIFEFTTFHASDNVPYQQRLQNLIALWRNPTAFLETGVWPPVILRRLGLAWLQPVDGMKRYRRIFREKK